MSYHRGVARDIFGNSLNEASVTVLEPGTTTEAALFSEETLTDSLDNPITTGVDGVYEFYVSPGYYDIQVAKSGFTTVTLTDQAVGSLFGHIEHASNGTKSVGASFEALDNTFTGLTLTSVYNSAFEITSADRLKYIGAPSSYALFTAMATIELATSDDLITFEIIRTGDVSGFATGYLNMTAGDADMLSVAGLIAIEENDEFYVHVKLLSTTQNVTVTNISLSAQVLS